MLRRPPAIGSKRPFGRLARRNTAALRWAADSGGRGPSATCRAASAYARPASKRSTFASGTAAGLASPSLVSSRIAPVTSAPAISTCSAMSAASERLVVARHRLEQVCELLARGGTAGRDVLARYLVGRRRVAAQDLARDRLAVHLVGAVVEARPAGEAVHRLQRQVGRVAQRPVDLQGAIDDVVQRLGAVELDQADVPASGCHALRVHLPRSVQR